MSFADTGNGLFEMLGGLFIVFSCVQLYKDKGTRGLSKWQVIFFTAWGWWNLYFYPAYGAWLSFAGGIGVVTTNSVYLAMACYYGRSK